MAKKVVKKTAPSKKAIYFALQCGEAPTGPFNSVAEAKNDAFNDFDIDYDDIFIVKAVLKAEVPKSKIDWKPV